MNSFNNMSVGGGRQSSLLQEKNWCVTCEDVCLDHPNICTICGDALQVRTNNTPVNNYEETVNNNGVGGDSGEVWENPSIEALDPTAATSTSRPTSKNVLKDIPRIVLENENCSFFYDVVIHIHQGRNNTTNETNHHSNAISNKKSLENVTVAEFGPSCPYTISNATLIPAPNCLHSGRPKFSSSLSSHPPSIRSSINVEEEPNQKKNFILFMERGGGITFVKKALAAQEAGACAVICANHVNAWPYIMKDSSNEAKRLNLKIPMVMVSKSDGQSLLRLLRKSDGVASSIQTQRKPNNECVICSDTFAMGQTVLRLPSCHHIFHESCAMRWLQQHNNCPYCRKELPTDDLEYEQERRRRQSSQANSTANTHTNHVSYDSWNSLFG